jgi:chemotaxis protein MotB
MITLCDLTLLLFGCLVLWHVTQKPAATRQKSPAAMTKAIPRPVTTAAPIQGNLKPEEWAAMQDEMASFIGDVGLAKEVNVESRPNELLVSLKDSVPFGSAKADLRSQALPVLEKVVSMVLSHAALALEISGHTDSVPIANGTFPSNWELSAARASRVARYLVEKCVHPSRIAVQGYANQRPRVVNSSVDNRRANRRVEIRLYYNAASHSAKP